MGSSYEWWWRRREGEGGAGPAAATATNTRGWWWGYSPFPPKNWEASFGSGQGPGTEDRKIGCLGEEATAAASRLLNHSMTK